ncbi:YggT family protein [uncultured Arcanobacterium sp.]|uniref:YggT family protein n=1 Tax=uncultured Arcanobacterium sp. TaxID=487520 RepID=UPI002613644C|nr:YggT family protein [uncultured Arcanobacterium sp.]
MTYVILLLYWLLELYLLVLIGRVIIDLVQILNRDWRPAGVILVISNLIYRFTDPPLRFLGRYIPPVRLGNVSLDVGFIVLYAALKILQSLLHIF